MFIFYCLPFLWDTRDCSKGPGEGVSGDYSLDFGPYSCHLPCGSSAECHQHTELNCFLILMTKTHTLALPSPSQTVVYIPRSEPSMLLMLFAQNVMPWERWLPCDSEAGLSPWTCARQVKGCHSKPLICCPWKACLFWCFGGEPVGNLMKVMASLLKKKKAQTNFSFNSRRIQRSFEAQDEEPV